MVSAYMPDVKVEIAFNAGYSTPTGSRTWTDVSSYVELGEGIQISHGRADELGVADANTLTLTLDNTDGRFTAGKTGGAYYPNVKIGRPIKVTSTPVGGAASIRFVGYVDEWPVAWDGTDNYAEATITARSRLARLGFNAELRSTLEQEILFDDPGAYYPLTEAEGATEAADVSGYSQPPLVMTGSGPDVAFGTGVGAQGVPNTAAVFPVGGKSLYQAYLNPIVTTGAAYVECFFSCPAPPVAGGNDFFVAYLAPAPGSTTVSLGIRIEASTGNAVMRWSGSEITGSPVCDGEVHHLAARYSGATKKLYVDGVEVASGAALAGDLVDFYAMYVGKNMLAGFPAIDVPATVSHVAAGGVISAARILEHATIGADGVPEESASDRIGRYAEFAGIPAAEYAGDANTYLVGNIDTTGRSVLDAMRTVEASEGGVLFDARDNTLTFKGRAARYNTVSTLTLSAALQQIEADISPKLDRSTLVNDVTVTAADGSTSHVSDQTSIDNYGYAKQSLELASSSTDAYQAAAWRVAQYAEPQPRVPALGVNLLPFSLADQTTILGFDIGSRFTASALPIQAPATSIDYFVEGYTENIGRETYGLVFNVSPTTGYNDMFVLNSATLGVLNTNRLAY